MIGIGASKFMNTQHRNTRNNIEGHNSTEAPGPSMAFHGDLYKDKALAETYTSGIL